jgi:hypothetical protein
MSRKIGFYVISFNAPEQFEALIESIIAYDLNFLVYTHKFLLNNSTDLGTSPQYEKICQDHKFGHIKKENLGISGGRRFIAQHAKENGLTGYFFFEDDMLFHADQGICVNGYQRKIDNLFFNIIEASEKESLEYVKLSYTEVHSHNGIQWAWYRFNEEEQEKIWPEKYKELKKRDIKYPSYKDLPLTNFTDRSSYNDLGYLLGEIYYSNWPQYITASGNGKIFVDTDTKDFSEDFWMKTGFEKSKSGELKSAVLLLSPINHSRFQEYNQSERKEY